LFQYAAALGAGGATGHEVIVDSRQHRTWGHPLRTALNAGATREATPRELLSVGWPAQGRPTRAQRVKDKCARPVARAYVRLSSEGSETVAPAGPFEFVDFDSAGSGSVYLSGYFQSERYFFHVRDQILNALSATVLLGKNLGADIRRKHHTGRLIGVSFRLRVDYKFFGIVLPREYYTSALPAVVDDDAVYVVFSDVAAPDVKHLFPRESRLEMAPRDPVAQLGLLANMNAVVCANSTFSWWGAWLGEQAGLTDAIFVPQPWINLPGSPAPRRWNVVGHAGHVPDDLVSSSSSQHPHVTELDGSVGPTQGVSCV
jgi:hypothetical protein